MLLVPEPKLGSRRRGCLQLGDGVLQVRGSLRP